MINVSYLQITSDAIKRIVDTVVLLSFLLHHTLCIIKLYSSFSVIHATTNAKVEIRAGFLISRNYCSFVST